MAWKRAIREDGPPFLANPFGRAYWGRLKYSQTDLPDEFKALVDEVLENAGDNYTRDSYNDTMQRLERAE